MKNFQSILFSVAIVLASVFLGKAYVDRAIPPSTISVTGAGTADFTSDLIVWEGQFTRLNTNLNEGFDLLSKDREIVRQYLLDKGIDQNDFVFLSIRTSERRESQYYEGNYTGDRFVGYQLSQSIKIESKNVELIEKVSREVTELLNKGVQFRSEAPRYYYTQLADLKIEMISKATEDAKHRAEKIAEHGGAQLKQLKTAKMGVFQITGQNSSDEYSWGGSFNTSDKNKTASITMRLEYEIK